jgi:hypothetical protein
VLPQRARTCRTSRPHAWGWNARRGFVRMHADVEGAPRPIQPDRHKHLTLLGRFSAFAARRQVCSSPRLTPVNRPTPRR